MPSLFGIRINGAAAEEYHFRQSAATITYTMAFEQELARVYAGISIADWEAMPGTPQWIPETGGKAKTDILMLYRMSQWIPAAANDAAAKQSEQQSRRRH